MFIVQMFLEIKMWTCFIFLDFWKTASDILQNFEEKGGAKTNISENTTLMRSLNILIVVFNWLMQKDELNQANLNFCQRNSFIAISESDRPVINNQVVKVRKVSDYFFKQKSEFYFSLYELDCSVISLGNECFCTWDGLSLLEH